VDAEDESGVNRGRVRAKGFDKAHDVAGSDHALLAAEGRAVGIRFRFHRRVRWDIDLLGRDAGLGVI
jgi:hypothetical protein